MALTAIGGEVGGNVVGVRGALKIFQMAAHAGGGGQVVVVVDVAVGAFPWRHSMRSSQQKSSRGVIKFSVQPIVSTMARLTVAGELGSNVIRVGGRLKLFEVAGRAGRGHGLKLAVRQTFVASIAIDGGMRSREWEAIVVLLYLLQ